jgi:hypothetical protein
VVVVMDMIRMKQDLDQIIFLAVVVDWVGKIILQ